MIKTLYTIGRVFSEHPDYSDYFKHYKNPFPKGGDAKVITVVVAQKQLKEVRIEAFKTSFLKKYLFREPAGKRGTFLTPSSFYYHTGKKDARAESLIKFYDKLKRTFKNNENIFGKYLELDSQFSVLSNAFEEATNTLEKDGNVLVTFSFDGKYPGDIPEMDNLLREEAYNKYKQSNKGDFVGYNQVCAVTQQVVPEVWGKVDTLGFTVDDHAFIRGGFEFSNAWKMFPVSKDVVPLIEGAKDMVLSHFKYSFGKMSYVIVPKFIGWNDETILEALSSLLDTNKETLSAQGNAIINNENFISEILKEEKLSTAGVSYDFFFFQQNQAQFLVKIHITDVLPSTLSHIENVKRIIEKRYKPIIDRYIPAKGKKSEVHYPYPLNFGNLKDYFSVTIKTDTVFNPVFFEIMEKVFYRQAMSQDLFINAFLKKMVLAFKNYGAEPYKFYQHGYQTFAFWQYFAHLGLLKDIKISKNMDKETLGLNIDSFIDQHPHYFSSNAVKASFICGCLVEELLAAQRKHLKNEPFRKHLNNLSLDLPKLQSIMLKWEVKMNEYVKADYIHKAQLNQLNELKSLAFPGLIGAPDCKKSDISYAFALGMVMQAAFTKEAIRVYKNK
jgi:CRISPR-associated Csh1 family protein